MNTALVTGATGMVGSYLVQDLRTMGWHVRALVRNPEKAGRLRRMGAEIAQGDLSDAKSIMAAAVGCDVIFHAAAAIGSGGDWEPFRAGNVEGTRHVIDAAARANARLAHISSTSVFGRNRYFDEPTDESKPLPELPSWDVYGRSKQLAEGLVFEATLEGRIWATILRPPVMYGRWDRQFLPRLAPVLEKGIFPLFGRGRSVLTLVSAGAVSEGAILASQTEQARGEVYHLTNDFPVRVRDLLVFAEEGLGHPIRSPNLPLSAARVGFTALACGLIAAGHRDLSRHAQGLLEMVTRDNPFTSEKARRELGWAPQVHPSRGLPEAFRWWKANRQGLVESEGGHHAYA